MQTCMQQRRFLCQLGSVNLRPFPSCVMHVQHSIAQLCTAAAACRHQHIYPCFTLCPRPCCEACCQSQVYRMSHASTPSASHASCRQKADAEGYATDLHAMVDSLEAALGTNLPLGYNPKISFYQHTSEPIPHFYRPLVVYAAFEFMAWMNHNMLRAAGYSKHTFPVHSAGTTRSNGDVQRAPCCNESAAATAASSVVYFTANMPAADTACSTCGDTLCSSSSSSNSKAAAGSVKLSACTVRGAECDCECTPERARIHRHASTSSHANAAGDDERPIPIVFLHGVGMGLLPYLRLLVALAATGKLL